VLVSSTEVEYEVEAELDGAPVTLHFHPRCHDVWKAEIDGLAGTDASEAPTSHPSPPAA
jgi:hypothetical protein